MANFVVMSPSTEPLRYGHDIMARQTADAHAQGKLAKFVIGWRELKDPDKSPTPDNFKFNPCQAEAPDIVIFIDKNGKPSYLKGAELNGTV